MMSQVVNGEAGPAQTEGHPSADRERIHHEAALRLATLDQRYTAKRRAVVEILAAAGRPLTIAELLVASDGLPMSSVYRNLTVLCEARVTRRLPGMDDLGRYELDEGLSGHHHHHLVCSACGTITDIPASARLERALAEVTRQASEDLGFLVNDHRLDLQGRCSRCL
ncbi:MAG: Fur family transcriptional regulator [Acidimicrobiales bacterium]